MGQGVPRPPLTPFVKTNGERGPTIARLVVKPRYGVTAALGPSSRAKLRPVRTLTTGISEGIVS